MNAATENNVCVTKCVVSVRRRRGWRLGISRKQLVEKITLLLECILLDLTAKSELSRSDIVIQKPIKLRFSLDYHASKSLMACGSNFSEVQSVLLANEELDAMVKASVSQLEKAVEIAASIALNRAELAQNDILSNDDSLNAIDTNATSLLICLQSLGTPQKLMLLMGAIGWADLCSWFRKLCAELQSVDAATITLNDRESVEFRVVNAEAMDNAVHWMNQKIGVNGDATSHALLCGCICAIATADESPEEQRHLTYLIAKGHEIVGTSHLDNVKGRSVKVVKKGIASAREVVQTQNGIPNFSKLPKEVRISTALPFLMLRPLHNLGVWPWIASAFSVYERDELLPALAKSLAWKCMSMPIRGWLRSPMDEETVSAFAGSFELDPECVDLLEQDYYGLLTPAMRHLGNLVSETSGKKVVTSPELGIDCFPWAIDEHRRYPLPWFLPTTVEPNLLIAANAATPEFLSMLSSNSIGFLIPVPPVASEELTRYTVAGRYWWSNVSDLKELEVHRATRCYEPLTNLAEEVWSEMGSARPAIAYKRSTRFEQILATIVSAAFGEIANSLWSHREATSPILMLERFADFDGTVRFEEDRLIVRLPWGQRYDDLESHGWLRDVKNIPWLGGRHVTFCRG